MVTFKEFIIPGYIHIRVYYLDRLWAHSLGRNEPALLVTNWGWTAAVDGNLTPYWSALPKAADVCVELRWCRCVKACSMNKCTCKRASYLAPTSVCAVAIANELTLLTCVYIN